MTETPPVPSDMFTNAEKILRQMQDQEMDIAEYAEIELLAKELEKQLDQLRKDKKNMVNFDSPEGRAFKTKWNDLQEQLNRIETDLNLVEKRIQGRIEGIKKSLQELRKSNPPAEGDSQ